MTTVATVEDLQAARDAGLRGRIPAEVAERVTRIVGPGIRAAAIHAQDRASPQETAA